MTSKISQKCFTILIIVSAFLFTSCGIGLRELTYLHKIETGGTIDDIPDPGNYQVRPNDQLYIKVIGDDPLNIAFLNLMDGQTFSNLQNIELITYMVDENGYINYPQLGRISVSGKTVQQIQETIQEQVNQYVINTSVHVKLVNRTITVLGEVRMPGVKPIANNYLTIFEALGAAGDISDYGNRRNVKLIRNTGNGTQVVKLDLTNPRLLNSPYYYIQPHDLIYVEPRNRVYGLKTLPYMTHFTLVTSLVTTSLLVLSFMKTF